eukprot:g752.t1
MNTRASSKSGSPTFAKKPPTKTPPKKAAGRSTKRVVSKPRSPSGTGKGFFGDDGGVDNLDKWYGPNRSLFLPRGLLNRSEVASYLTGELPGDYGYDPLGLGQNVETVEQYRGFELIHARWAMLGAAGMIIPEGLAANGADIKSATWFETGAGMLNGGTLNYFAVPWGVISNPLPLVAVVLVEVGLLAAAESYRRTGKGPAGYAPGFGKFDSSVFEGLDPLYPGGPLDCFDLARDPEIFQELKVKEIKNGRLAMMATLGFYVQAAVTGEGPYANWAKHVSDPFGYNLLTILGNEDRVPTL